MAQRQPSYPQPPQIATLPRHEYEALIVIARAARNWEISRGLGPIKEHRAEFKLLQSLKNHSGDI